MRLDRFSGDTAKYSLIEHRHGDRVTRAGDKAEDFFVIKLKDQYAGDALRAYATAALRNGDHELAVDVLKLADLAEHHPNKRRPD